jgi:hypothetical protein
VTSYEGSSDSRAHEQGKHHGLEQSHPIRAAYMEKTEAELGNQKSIAEKFTASPRRNVGGNS